MAAAEGIMTPTNAINLVPPDDTGVTVLFTVMGALFIAAFVWGLLVLVKNWKSNLKTG